MSNNLAPYKHSYEGVESLLSENDLNTKGEILANTLRSNVCKQQDTILRFDFLINVKYEEEKMK